MPLNGPEMRAMTSADTTWVSRRPREHAIVCLIYR